MTRTEKPFAPACLRNRDAILAALAPRLVSAGSVLEIGAGTGQHAVHFAAALPQLVWQVSDRADNLAGIRLWLDEATLANTPGPLELDVTGEWPTDHFDAVYTANTLHIMGWDAVQAFFAGLPGILAPGGRVFIYGPFHRDGTPTSASNAEFDARLRAEDPRMGVRDDQDILALATAAGLALTEDLAMPANNRLLVLGLRS